MEIFHWNPSKPHLLFLLILQSYKSFFNKLFKKILKILNYIINISSFLILFLIRFVLIKILVCNFTVCWRSFTDDCFVYCIFFIFFCTKTKIIISQISRWRIIIKSLLISSNIIICSNCRNCGVISEDVFSILWLLMIYKIHTLLISIKFSTIWKFIQIYRLNIKIFCFCCRNDSIFIETVIMSIFWL